MKFLSWIRYSLIYILRAVPEETHRFKIIMAENDAHQMLDAFIEETGEKLEMLQNDNKVKALLICELNKYVHDINVKMAFSEISGAIFVNDSLFIAEDRKEININ